MERNVMGELNVYRGPARSRTSVRSQGDTAWTGTRSPSTGGTADWARLEAEAKKIIESGIELADRIEAA